MDIGGIFASNYVITDLAHKAFLAQANDDPRLAKVYEDEYALIYQVVSP